jgi:hypothetical protein
LGDAFFAAAGAVSQPLQGALLYFMLDSGQVAGIKSFTTQKLLRLSLFALCLKKELESVLSG